MTPRTLLLLYPGAVRSRQELMRRHRDGLRARGLRVVLADDWIDAHDAAHFDAVVQIPPPERVGEVVEALARVPCDAVLAQSEAAILAGALLCDQRGLRGLPLAGALHCVGKHLSRVALAHARVPQPEFALVDSAAAVRRFADGRYPVVLKGVASAMSRLVTFVRSAPEVDRAVAQMHACLPQSLDILRLQAFARASGLPLECAPTREFLVERFAAGVPVETDGLVVGAQIACYGVIEQVMSPPPLFYVEGYLLPADRADAPAIRVAADAALTALGVRDTGYSVELRATADGPRVIEVNGRLGEDDAFGDLFACATGGEPFLHAIELALGGHPEVRAAHAPHYALAYRCSFADGVVRRVPAARDLLGTDSVRLGVCVVPGTHMHAPPHPETFPHMAWVLAHDASSSRAAYARARAAVDALSFDIE